MATATASKGIDQVVAMLAELHDGAGRLLKINEMPWRSVTFSGHRYLATLNFSGLDACVIGEAIIAELPGSEFNIAGRMVADAAIVWVNHQLEPMPTLTFEIELLLLDTK